MSVTVHGCVSWPSGTITFTDLETCLAQNSCVHWTGVHANQVALTLSGATNNAACNDTFYGCVNWTTGKFQVVIPEGCCVVIGVECPQCGVFTPLHLNITFQGVVYCSECFYEEGWGYYKHVSNFKINKSWRATQDPIDPCIWWYKKANGHILRKYSDSGCSNLISEETFDMYIGARIKHYIGGNLAGTKVYCRASSNGLGGLLLFQCASSTYPPFDCLNYPNSSCMNGIVYNKSLACGSKDWGAKEGNATIEESCINFPLWLASETYEVGNCVKNLAHCYMCILAHGPAPDDHEPPSFIYWEEIDF